jgi:hypothetical protein
MRSFRLGLLTRIVMALAAVSLIPLAVVAVRLIGVNADALKNQVLETHSMAARTAAGRVESFIRSLRSLSTTLAAHPSVLQDPRSDAARELLAGTLQARPDVAAVFLLDASGATIIGAQQREFAAELEPVLAQPVAAPLSLVRGRQRRWLRLDEPLAGGDGTLRLVAGDEPLSEMLSSIELGEAAEEVLASAAGEVLAGSAASLDSFPPSLVERASALKLDGSGEFEPPPGQSENTLGAYATVNGTDWFVASRQPVSVARATLVRMQRQSWIAVGLALALVALLTLLARFTLVKPIRALIGAQRRMAGLSPLPTGGNEIEQLRSSFATIERRLRDQQALDKVFLGRFQVIEVLGEGAMGTVFRGWDPKLERQVALKTVRFAQDQLGTQRRELASQLLREATAAARINHANIVSIFDVEDSPEVAFIAMEFVEGIGLDQLLWRCGAMRAAQVCALGARIGEALAASHHEGVVHRDVKPANVLLGFDGAVKVADFGIAEFLSNMSTDSDSFFGTPGYVPPETLRGEGYDELGDLFSLGVVLYQCLTGVQPFAGKNLRDTAIRTLRHEPTRPVLLFPETPMALDEVVIQLLAKDRLLRPQSARQTIDLLRSASPDPTLRWSAETLPRGKEPVPPHTVAGSQMIQTRAVATRQGAP